MGKKRKDRHGVVLKAALPVLQANDFEVTQFHHYSRMPKSLKGVPDLYLMGEGKSWWIEIKPKYANYMRDQMSTHQWQWLHARYQMFSDTIRYAIVENSEELLNAVLHGEYSQVVWMTDYHWDRYNKWRRGR